jgi:hypothetical protein
MGGYSLPLRRFFLTGQLPAGTALFHQPTRLGNQNPYLLPKLPPRSVNAYCHGQAIFFVFRF